MRREVESLLASDTSDVSFLDRLPLASESVLADPFAAPLMSTDLTESQARCVRRGRFGAFPSRAARREKLPPGPGVDSGGQLWILEGTQAVPLDRLNQLLSELGEPALAEQDYRPAYVAPTGRFRTIKDSDDLEDLLAQGDSDSVKRIVSELHLNVVQQRAAG